MSNIQQITQDGGIMKVNISPGLSSKAVPKWKKGTKAFIYYQVYSVPLEGERAQKLKEADQRHETNKNIKGATGQMNKLNLSSLAANLHSTCSHKHDHDKTTKCTDKKCNQSAEEQKKTYKGPDPRFERVLLADNRRDDTSPLELKTNMGFTFKGLELAVKSLKIGECAKFFMTSVYCDVSGRVQPVYALQTIISWLIVGVKH
jgi:hypothetical protein